MPAALTAARNRAMLVAADGGAPTDELAARYGLKRPSVMQILAHERLKLLLSQEPEYRELRAKDLALAQLKARSI